MSDRYPHVFSPIRIGPVDVANRLYFSPHGNPLSAGGVPSDDFLHYYEARAANGVGLLLQGLPVLPQQGGRQCAYQESAIPAFRAVADAVHGHGAKIIAQLAQHPGQLAEWGPLRPSKPAAASSVFKLGGGATTHEMSKRHIARMIDAFVQNVRHLRQAGYDGIQIYCTHGGLLESFLTPFWNTRTDEYGGTLENRMRFFVEVLEGTREAAGDDMAVGCRLIADELLPGGLAKTDIREVITELVKRDLVDFVDLSLSATHSEDRLARLEMPSYLSGTTPWKEFVEGAREAAGNVPVMSALGRIVDVATAEKVLSENIVDMVGMARGLIAEPALLRNASHGREDESRTCVGLNYCLASYVHRGRYGCVINPATGRERRWGTFPSAPQHSKVVVVGGGPAGLEAARVCAERGHDVVLFEREQHLGGQLRLWSTLPQRELLAEAISWYARQLDRLGVEVNTGAEVTADLVRDLTPDAVLLATGARYDKRGHTGYRNAPITGWDQDFVYTPEDVLESGVRPSGTVVLLDDEGHNTGVGIAEILASAGAKVVFISIAEGWNARLRESYEWHTLYPRLRGLGVRFLRETYITEIGSDHRVAALDIAAGETHYIPEVDAVILATIRAPQDQLARALDGNFSQFFLLGDAAASRGFADATFDGQFFGRMVGEVDAPTDLVDAYFAPLAREDVPRPAGNWEM